MRIGARIVDKRSRSERRSRASKDLEIPITAGTPGRNKVVKLSINSPGIVYELSTVFTSVLNATGNFSLMPERINATVFYPSLNS